jgi:O-antigen ligase
MRKLAFLLSLVIVFTIPWEDAITIGTLGTLTRIIGLVAAFVWLGSALISGRVRKPHPFHVLVIIFVLWNILSIFWSGAYSETLQHIITYSQLAILAWILWDLYTTPKTVSSALQAYILGAYVAIGSTIYNYMRGQEISIYSGGRYAGANANAGDLALILALGIPLAWYLAISAPHGTRGNIQKIINIAHIPLAIFAIMLTASRTAIFAIIPSAIYIALTATRLKPILRIFLPIVLLMALFILEPFIPRSSLDRLGTTWGSIAAGDLGGRVKLWEKSFAIFSEHPIIGIGAGDLPVSTELGAVAHNSYLSVMAELGVIGFILFAMIFIEVFYQALRQAKQDGGLWLAVFAIWAIGVFTLSWEFRKPTWLFLSLIVISANCTIQAIQSSTPAREYYSNNVQQLNTDATSKAISFTKSD